MSCQLRWSAESWFAENAVMAKIFLVLMVATMGWLGPVSAGMKNSDCLDCHGDRTLVKTNAVGVAVSLFVDPARLKVSVHQTNSYLTGLLQ